MPSQEDYLDNLLKGIGNTEEEENSRKESEEGSKMRHFRILKLT